MNIQDIKVLIFPDIHGRTFWKDAIAKFPIKDFPNLQIVFLGDYLDPYTGWEPISKEDAFANFEEILDLNDPRVTMLIGNHDWHYFVNLDSCRMDMARSKDIEHMFKENMNRFKVHKVIKVNDVKYLFTHAGITQQYLDNVASMADDEYDYLYNLSLNKPDKTNKEALKWIDKMSSINETYNFDLFEKCLENYDDNFYAATLSMISRERGGYVPYGSPIWADAHEHIYQDDIPGYYQIFGHTMTFPTGVKDYAISYMGHNWAMIDASQAFIITNNNDILPLNLLNNI